jgi:uncharacterized protein YecE (DUF72 family)
VAKIRIGVSGWNYDEWKGNFYPEGLPESDRLAHAASVFDTIEVNGTFYGLTDPGTCRAWREAVPDHVELAIKGSRYITHMKRMGEPETPLANFFASGILEIGPNLGPVLWQLPARHRFDVERLDRFLALLPKDTVEAAELARGHDRRVEDPAYGDGSRHRMRHVLEVRHQSFLNEEAVEIVRSHGVALCFSHSAEWPYIEEITAGFVYLRLHGPRLPYASEYSEGELRVWARRIEAWRGGSEPGDAARITEHEPPDRRERDVYVYFDNTAHGYAPADATKLTRLLGA